VVLGYFFQLVFVFAPTFVVEGVQGYRNNKEFQGILGIQDMVRVRYFVPANRGLYALSLLVYTLASKV
jgi:hypothetical protein